MTRACLVEGRAEGPPGGILAEGFCADITSGGSRAYAKAEREYAEIP